VPLLEVKIGFLAISFLFAFGGTGSDTVHGSWQLLVPRARSPMQLAAVL
jgi:hypothetical protein